MRRASAIACAALLLAVAAVLGASGLRGEAPVPTAAVPLIPATVGSPPADDERPELLEREVVTPSEQAPKPTVLQQIRNLLESSYYETLPAGALEHPTITGTLELVGDPYTEYLSPLDYEKLREELAGGYYGVGLSIWPGGGGLLVTSSLEGPAQEAGILPGDVILTIDGHDTGELPFDRSAALMKGAEGTVVHLKILREGKKKLLEVKVQRRKIDVPAVYSRMVKSGGRQLGYIQVVSFREDVATDVATAASTLLSRGAEGFVLDLRSDPGGLLSQAVELTSVFLAEGEVCEIWSRYETRTHSVSGKATVSGSPLAVLIDRWTASAAEIVAAALRDNDRAILVGRRTYGKASVQTLLDLSNGGALKLTTATYLTPKGVDINGEGIRPDVRALDDPLTRRDEALAAAKKALLEQFA
jgi:carboxyl-terminal processing protease